MTRKVLERIERENVNVYLNIKSLKEWHKQTEKHDVSLAEIRGYLTALLQLGFITEAEKRVLHCYMTL